MSRAAVLGAGLVGGLIARDLAAEGLEVLACDARDAALGTLDGVEGIATRRCDLSTAAGVRAAVEGADVAAVAVPGFMGTSVLREVIRAGVPLADISFSPEDPFELNDEARKAGVPVIVDCGVAPGLSNLFVGKSVAEMDAVDAVLILVGGLPVRRVWPYEYRLVFSLTDVLEEYTRPSRFREHGVEVVRPALSEIELVDLPRAGTLEAFNTDGLRTLLRTVSAPNLKEKTLRWPGHAERMRMIRDTGFLSDEPVEFGGVSVRPRALTERLLLDAWTLPPGDDEFTVLRVVVEGRRRGTGVRDTWDLYDRTDPVSRATSMARTTGFPCAIVARLLAEKVWTAPGVHPPELLAHEGAVAERMLSELKRRGVAVERRNEVL
ncbi:MAG TPA: saccharopine dehydrogenase C-terminal domain-containing protein [Candidatus Polarisedimenticolaceae bacterium]